MHARAKGFRRKLTKLGLELKDGKKLLAGLLWQSWARRCGVQRDSFAEAVEIGCAIRTLSEVPFEFTALRRRELRIELLANVVQDVVATNGFLFHAVI